jgi:FMN phosphatase YigB (HAD superfamily)
MIGDNYEVDIKGAQGIGMDQVLYNVAGATLDDEAPKPTYTIASLLELKEIV